jgi:hypothetical protein
MQPDPESNQDETNPDYDTTSVAHVAAVSGTTQLWKITSTTFDVYYTGNSTFAKLAECARDSVRLLKIGSIVDDSGRRVVLSMAISPDGLAEAGDQHSFESPRDDYLF